MTLMVSPKRASGDSRNVADLTYEATVMYPALHLELQLLPKLPSTVNAKGITSDII